MLSRPEFSGIAEGLGLSSVSLIGFERSSKGPLVSFVIPAFDAVETIDRTLESVASQSSHGWEAIVVDDGSLDGTAAHVEEWTLRDPRVKLVRQQNGGPSAARNAGIAAATGEWLLFLDADDTISRRYLSTMLAAAHRQPDADVLICGYRLVDSKGRLAASYPAPQFNEHPFLLLARELPFVIHAAIVRRTVVLSAGNFDADLITNEDWDFWVRIARTGAKFRSVSKILVTYWSSPKSNSRNGLRMLTDSEVVMSRIRTRDPRVLNPAPEYADGHDSGDWQDARLYSLLVTVGTAIGGGEDPEVYMDAFEHDFGLLDLDIPSMSATLLEGLMIGACCPMSELLTHWPRMEAPLLSVAADLEKKMRFSGLAYGFIKSLERQLLRPARITGEVVLHTTAGVSVRPAILRRGYLPPEHVDSVIFSIPRLKPRSIFVFELPAFGHIAGSDLRRAIRRQQESRIARRLLRPSRLSSALLATTSFSKRAYRKANRLVGRSFRDDEGGEAAVFGLPEVAWPKAQEIIASEYSAVEQSTPAARIEVDERKGYEENDPDDPYAAWNKVFEKPDPWNYTSAYEQLKYERTLEILPPISGRGLELACAEGLFTIQLAPRLEHLRAVDVSSKAIERARERCAGLSNVEFGLMDVFNDPIPGAWDLIVCSEVLYFMKDTDQLAALAGRVRDALKPGGYFTTAHAFQLTDCPDRTAFDWGDPFAAETIAQTFHDTAGLEHVSSFQTVLYRVDLFRRAERDAVSDSQPEVRLLPLGTDLEPDVAGCVVWNGAVRLKSEADAEERAVRIPALMYHRIADSGPAGLADYALSPSKFEHQLRFLRRRGYYSVDLDEWEDVARKEGSLRGRPIMLTFDDATLDFYETAWPILRRNGFSAHMFVVTDKVGGTADWDAAYGEPAPLMSWGHLAELAQEGLTIGSHLASHISADCLNSKELLGEAARSRATLERRLGIEIRSVAVPFGASDSRVAQVLEMAGYERLFLAEGGVAPVVGHPLYTPRVEILATIEIENFGRAVGAPEPPDPGDLLGLGVPVASLCA